MVFSKPNYLFHVSSLIRNRRNCWNRIRNIHSNSTRICCTPSICSTSVQVKYSSSTRICCTPSTCSARVQVEYSTRTAVLLLLVVQVYRQSIYSNSTKICCTASTCSTGKVVTVLGLLYSSYLQCKGTGPVEYSNITKIYFTPSPCSKNVLYTYWLYFFLCFLLLVFLLFFQAKKFVEPLQFQKQ